MAAGGFGECPRCGKLTLIQKPEYDESGNVTYIEVKCVNCGFKKIV